MSDNNVDELLTLDDCIGEVEQSLREYTSRKVVMPTKLHFDIPGTMGFMRVMPAAISKLGYAGTKIYVDSTYSDVNSPSLFVLFDIAKGIPVALLAANRLSQLRTAAASALATRYLANEDETCGFIIGSGKHARTQLEGITRVRKICKAYVYSPSKEHREIFAREMSQQLGIDVLPAGSVAKCRESRCQIICSATTSSVPVISLEHIVNGSHINTIGSSFRGRSELDPSIILNSKIFVDCMAQAISGIEGSDLADLIAANKISSNQIDTELGEVITGKKRGRNTRNEITIFKNTGMAIYDVACAALVYKRAMMKNVGHRVNV